MRLFELIVCVKPYLDGVCLQLASIIFTKALSVLLLTSICRADVLADSSLSEYDYGDVGEKSKEKRL